MHWLLCPDAKRWRNDPAYRPEVAEALRAAFARVAPPAKARSDDYLWASGLVAPWLSAHIAPPQRIRVCFLFAQTHESDLSYARAVDWIDEALGVAARGHLHRELAELLSYRGRLLRALAKYGAAAEDVNASLALLVARAEREEAIDPAVRLELVSQLASYEFFLAHYHAAARLVKEARRLTPQAPTLTMAAADALWVQAHLERTRGLPERALRPALTVAEVYAREANPTSQDRIQTFVAQVTLDLASTAPGGVGSAEGQAFLRLARTHLAQAELLARSAADRPGLGLAQLGRVRESRLRGRNEDRLVVIERVVRTARQLEDEALLAQALTSQGDELVHLGETEQGLVCYRTALKTLENSEVPALKGPARRALLQASEMDTV